MRIFLEHDKADPERSAFVVGSLEQPDYQQHYEHH